MTHLYSVTQAAEHDDMRSAGLIVVLILHKGALYFSIRWNYGADSELGIHERHSLVIIPS